MKKKLKILVVDDEKAVADILGSLIEIDGHKVSVTYDAPKALEIYQKEKSDLVLADISMPGMDGIDLTQKLLEIDKNAKVVVITGHIGTLEVELALNAGAKKFLKKPFSKSEIDEMIKDIMKVD